MKVYAETPVRRTRQLVLDLAVLVWVIVWIEVGRAVYHAIDKLSAAGRSVEHAGTSLASSLNDAAGQANRLPVVGDKLSDPLRGAGNAATGVANAGVAQQDAVGRIALLLALVVALLPILYLLGRYLPGRLAWIRQASGAARSRAALDEDLLALRALTHASFAELRRVDPRAGAAWASGDRAVVAALARLELASIGLRATP